MSADPGSKVEELFHAALNLDPADRAAFLDEACRDDPALRRSVDDLLRAIERKPRFLEKPAWSRYVEPGTDSRSDDEEPEPGLPFESLGEYRLIRRLGEGGMGTVYLAVQQSLGRKVALKVIRSEQAGSFEAEARFGREVQAISRLRHPNIVTVHGSGEDQEVRFFAMELIHGKGMDELLREAALRGETIPLPRVLGWIATMAWALDAAHQAGIIHRDVKPSNIRITPDGHAKLMDFSVAHHTGLTTLTLTGEFRGTPYYASPEQVKARSRGIDFRTDIYSLGVTLYEAATGRTPFDGETTEQVFHQILVNDPAPPRRLNPSIPADVETVITKAMEKEPDRRYRTMGDFALDLRSLTRGDPIAARPATLVRKSVKWIQRHRVFSFVLLALFLVAAALSVVLMEKARQQRQQFEIAEERFKPLKDLITQVSHQSHRSWRWSLEADPDNPGGHMLRALYELRFGTPDRALPLLEECRVNCRKRRDGSLEKDASYLIGLIELAVAVEGVIDSGERKRRIDEARQELRAAGGFDPVSGEVLFWREADPLEMTPPRASAAIRALRVDSEHFLMQLNIGLTIFDDLHRGGEIQDFRTAIQSFENARIARPDDLVSLTFMGRTYYFFARTFDFLDMADKAESCLEHALELAGSRPAHLLLNTLGAVCLLRGKNDRALALNQEALKRKKDSPAGNIHNVYSGIGKVLARKGRLDEAQEYYRKTLRLQITDVSAKIALTQILMQMDRGDEALEMIRSAIQTHIRRQTLYKSDYLQAPVFLLCSRIHLQRGDYDEAKGYLNDLYLMAIHSSSIFSRACLLIGTFPEDQLRNSENEKIELVNLAIRLANAAVPSPEQGERMPPICLSANGLAQHLYGNHQIALDYFEKAMKERKKWWPDDIREFHWTEDARDLYFLAMVHTRLAEEQVGGGEHEARARSCFEQAEELFARGKLPIETADIILRVRAKVRAVMNKQ